MLEKTAELANQKLMDALNSGVWGEMAVTLQAINKSGATVGSVTLLISVT